MAPPLMAPSIISASTNMSQRWGYRTWLRLTGYIKLLTVNVVVAHGLFLLGLGLRGEEDTEAEFPDGWRTSVMHWLPDLCFTTSGRTAYNVVR